MLRYDAVFDDDGSIRDGLSGFKRIAEGGTSFDNAWATGPYTRTSVPSIISGSYLWTYDGDIYEPARPHIAETFKKWDTTLVDSIQIHFLTNAMDGIGDLTGTLAEVLQKIKVSSNRVYFLSSQNLTC